MYLTPTLMNINLGIEHAHTSMYVYNKQMLYIYIYMYLSIYIYIHGLTMAFINDINVDGSTPLPAPDEGRSRMTCGTCSPLLCFKIAMEESLFLMGQLSPDAPRIEYLPIKLGHFGINVGKYSIHEASGISI